MHSRQYQLLLALLRYVYILLHICHGLFVVAIVVLVVLLIQLAKNTAYGGPSLLPPLRKEAGGLCPSSTTYSSLPTTQTRVVAGHVPGSRLSRLSRT